jgi:hypothetical protein
MVEADELTNFIGINIDWYIFRPKKVNSQTCSHSNVLDISNIHWWDTFMLLTIYLDIF